MSNQYQHRPTRVTAIRWTGANDGDIAAMMGRDAGSLFVAERLQGVALGDWFISEEGEYPLMLCDHDFHLTFERVKDD